VKLRLLAITEFLPCAEHSAGDRRFVGLLEILARQHDVDLYTEFDADYLSSEDVKRSTTKLEAHGVRLLGMGWPSLARALARKHYDVGLFEFYGTAERNAREFRRRQPGAKVIVDSVDVHFARERIGAEVGAFEQSRAENTRKRELTAYRNADAIIVVTDDDERILKAEADMPRLFVLPIIMSPRPRALVDREPELIFVGGFRHSPNLDGLRWFIDEIWPRVYRVMPSTRLTIIGSETPPEIKELDTEPGIQVLGFVEDTAMHLDRAAISVAPLRYGAGMKGKVVEAMSYGLPVVTTSVGAQGINGRSGEHFFVADDAADFAEALKILLGDPGRCRQMGLAGQKHIASLCSPEHIERTVAEMLDAIVPRHRSLMYWFYWRAVNAKEALRYVGRYLQLAR